MLKHNRINGGDQYKYLLTGAILVKTSKKERNIFEYKHIQHLPEP